VFKSFSALALLVAAVVGAQAQTGPGDAARAAVDTERARGGAVIVARGDVAAKSASCGGVGQVACDKVPDGQAEERAAAAAEPDALALAWAALGVIAFVALRRRPR
jgi:hypothetical protein